MSATAPTRTSRGPWRWGVQNKASAKMTIPALLWTLHDLGGEISDPVTGRAGTKLVEEARKRYSVYPTHIRSKASSGALSSIYLSLERGIYAGSIVREMNAKRTFRITLLLSEDEMPPRPSPLKITKVQPTVTPLVPKQRPIAPVAVVAPVADDEGTGNGGPSHDYEPDEPQPEVPEVPEPVQPTLPDDPGEPEVEDVVVTTIPPLLTVDADDDAFMLILEASQLLARAMIATNVRRPATVGPTDTEIDEAAKRMADTLAENQRLRRKLNEANETAAARAKEAEGLRKALLVAQGNLKAFQQNMGLADNREKALARLRDTQRTMAAPPTRRG